MYRIRLTGSPRAAWFAEWLDADDRRINETIARECGWKQHQGREINHGLVVFWTHTASDSVIDGADPPGYLDDPARLPEMWALCEARNLYPTVWGTYDVGLAQRYTGCRIQRGEAGGEWVGEPVEVALVFGPTLSDAFARALAAALESEGE